MTEREHDLDLTIRWLTAKLTGVRPNQVSDSAVEAMVRQAKWEDKQEKSASAT